MTAGLKRKLEGMHKRHRTIAAYLSLHGAQTANSIDHALRRRGFPLPDTYLNKTAIDELVEVGILIESRAPGKPRRYRLADGLVGSVRV